MIEVFKDNCIITGKEESLTAKYEKTTDLEGKSTYLISEPFECSYASVPGNVCDKQNECSLVKRASNYV